MPDDFLNTTSTTGRLSVGGMSTGNIEVSGDTDWFRISLVAGQTYQFDLRGSWTNDGTLYDPYMSIRGSSGTTKLQEEDDGGVGYNSRFTYTPTTSGYFYVAAGSNNNGTGTYEVAATNITPVTNNPPVVTALAGSSYAAGTVLTGTQLFSASDPQGTSDIDYIRVYDASQTGGGVWRYNGSIITPGGSGHPFEYANRGLLTYTVGTGSNTFVIEAFDNAGADSNDATLTIAGTVTNSPPVVTALAGSSYAAGTVLTGTQLFSASDPQGASDIDYIRVYDANQTGGGVWRYNGSIITPGGSGHPFEYANRGLLTYTVGTGSNTFVIEAFDNAGADSNDATLTIAGAVTPPPPSTWTRPVGFAYLPIAGSPVVTQGFGGDFSHDSADTTRQNYWVDFAAADGTPIRAMGNGVVIGIRTGSFQGDTAQGQFGNYVTVRHDGGVIATYAHLSTVNNLSLNQAVTGGITILGASGVTGFIDGAHLHISLGTTTTGSGSLLRAAIADDVNQSGSPAFFLNHFSSAAETGGLVNVLNASTLRSTDIFGTAVAMDSGSPAPNDLQDDLYGSSVDNRIFAGSGNDRLNGFGGNDTLVGGTGIDSMTGGTGNDTCYVDNALDKVFEAVGGGVDRVLASVSYTLAAGQEVESLTTTNAAGVGVINLTGNAFNNTVAGNNGVNALNGGAGVDQLYGYGGNDTYYVDNALDVVIEAVGGGTDRVWSAGSYTLAAGQEIETLSTTSAGGVNAINLTGNAFNNTIFGNYGANVLNGGLGNDTLSGLLGADTFVFNTALNAATNRDTIIDYNSAADTIRLENTGAGLFNTLAIGVLNASIFKANATGTATDADDRIIYNTVTGALFYDSNGNAAGGATQFATLNTHPAITNADFIVV